MRGARTIWRHGRVAVCIALLVGCDERRGPPMPEPQPRAVPSAPIPESTPSAAPSMLAPVARALEEVHDQKAEIQPPRDETARLSFGKGRLAQAMNDKVVFRDTKDGAVVAEAPVGAVHAVTAGVDGSLVALGLSGGARLEPRSSKPRSFGQVAFFPGDALFPDLEDPTRFYVDYVGEQQLFHYAFEADAGAFLPIDERFPLAGCTGALALTLDGAFLCATADGIERRAPRGRQRLYQLPAGVAAALRILPAKRLDELFSVSRTGEVVHLRLEQGTPVLGRFQLPAPPFAAATNTEALAFILLNPPAAGSARRFTLLVTDLEGQARLKVELVSEAAPPTDDWVKAVTGDKNLAISAFEPLVAVGGADTVTVWDYEQGRLIFTR